MSNTTLYTASKARLKKVKSQKGIYNWLFLAGGPGLGSDSLSELTNLLELPGTIWHLDLPGDGSNNTDDDIKYFANWSKALLEAAHQLENTVLVAHSTGGMYSLATKGLANILRGLILIDSAPDHNWQDVYSKFMENIKFTDEIHQLLSEFEANPSDDLLKQITLATMPYYLPKNSIKKTLSIFKELPFNCRSFTWSAENFDNIYHYQWVPDKIPTLILAGENDPITPLDLFKKHPAFQRSNIEIQSISNSGHFPWIDNPQKIKNITHKYTRNLQN
ncbi:MAG: alpha/beta hydrolase [Gammaproteobacteria bacterium]|nr:MAG: alpha/beta hydrolase [Gammaproteobacteria bacterium]UTW43843.1 alpha/beta hydrolase [bacterium SCSIO 12844]